MKLVTRYFFLAILLQNIASVSAQANFLGHTINFTPKERNKIIFDEGALTQDLQKKYSPLVKNEKDLNEFISALVQGKKYYLYSNTEYENMNDAERYLEKICSKINIDVNEKNLKIKIIRDPSLNACAFEDGTIYINIGLLARYNNEAEIAATLGHEIGHVIKSHAYARYKAQKEYFKNTYQSGFGANRSSYLSAWIATSTTSDKLISQEEESDDVAIELLKKSNYNTQALSKEQGIFLDLETKYKKLKSYKNYNSVFYLKTHPSSEKRIKKSTKVEFNNGKNFLVDSVFFTSLKKQAIDETINLYFEAQDFDQCIETAFVGNLKAPNDPYYLYYLTESTRRLIANDSTYKKLTFITGIYKKEFIPEKTAVQIVNVFSGGQLKKIKAGDLNSVCFKLTGQLLQTDSNDYKSFTNKKLLNKDTLPFNNYEDALTYFVLTNTQKKFLINNSFYGATCNSNTNTERENQKCNLITNVAEYYATKPGKKILFIIYDVDHFVTESGVWGSLDFSMVHNTSELIYSNVKANDPENKISTGKELNFDERSSLLNYLDLIYPLIKNKEEKKMTLQLTMKAMGGKSDPEMLVTRDSCAFNAGKITPELITILKKYNYEGIVFSSIYITNESQKGLYGGSSQMEKWKVKHFYLDARNEKVKFYLNPYCAVNIVSENFFQKVNVTPDVYKSFFYSVFRAANN